jgi:hypothetical protein
LGEQENSKKNYANVIFLRKLRKIFASGPREALEVRAIFPLPEAEHREKGGEMARAKFFATNVGA